MADVTWTNWEEMPELRIKFNGGAADSVITLNWENTIRVALGATYTASDNLDLHFGYAYDESPIPNAEARSPRIPDSDRHWLTIGGSYRVSENATLDISYAHLIVKDANVAKLAGAGIADEDFFRGSLTGSYEADVDILSASFNWRF